MAKENVIVFDGEDKFIKPKKSVYSKTKGIAKNVSANGEVISTSTTTQDTIRTLPIATPMNTSAVPSSQTTENVVNVPPSSGSSTRTTSKVLPTLNQIQTGEQIDTSNPVLQFDDKLTGRGLLSDAQGNKLVIPIGNPVNSNPLYGSNPDEGAPNPTPYPFCPSGYKYDISFGRCVKDTSLNPDVVCEPGYIKDINGICVEKPKLSRDVCPEGYIKDANDKCVRIGGEVCPDGYVKDDTGICVPKKIDTGPNPNTPKSGDVIISQPNFGQPVGGGGGGGGGSEESATAPVKKNYFWLYILGAGILYMAFKKKSN